MGFPVFPDMGDCLMNPILGINIGKQQIHNVIPNIGIMNFFPVVWQTWRIGVALLNFLHLAQCHSYLFYNHIIYLGM